MSASINEQTAQEEAEHAFLHHFYGHTIGEVVADRGNDSYCRFWVPGDASRGFNLECVVTACVGRKYKSDTEWFSASKDYKLAYRNALKLSGNDDLAAGLLLRWAERIAHLILETNHGQVEKLAAALVQHGRVSGQQVSEVLNGSNGLAPNAAAKMSGGGKSGDSRSGRVEHAQEIAERIAC